MENELNEKIIINNEFVNYQEGSIVSKVILKNGNGNVTYFAFDKGQYLSEHTAPFNALVNIIEGSAKVTISRVPYEINSGQSIIMPANKPHSVFATDKFKMILTMIK